MCVYVCAILAWFKSLFVCTFAICVLFLLLCAPVLPARKYVRVLITSAMPVVSGDRELCHLLVGHSSCVDTEITHRPGAWQMEIYHALYMSGGSGGAK